MISYETHHAEPPPTAGLLLQPQRRSASLGQIARCAGLTLALSLPQGLTALRCACILRALTAEQLPALAALAVAALLHGAISFTLLIAIAGSLAASLLSLVLPDLLTYAAARAGAAGHSCNRSRPLSSRRTLMERISQQIEPDSPPSLGLLALNHPAVVAVTRTMPHQADEPERPFGSSRLCQLLRVLLRRAFAPRSPRPEPRSGL